MYDPNFVAAQSHLREIERQASRKPRLMRYRGRQELSRHVHIYSVINVTIALAMTAALGVLALQGYTV